MPHQPLPSSKRNKPSSSSSSSGIGQPDHQDHEEQPLLPGLPDHLAHLCLSLVPPTLLLFVCRSWRRLLYSPSFPPFLSLYALLSPSNPKPNPNPDQGHYDYPIGFFSFDPISSTWTPLPSPPPHPPLHFLLLRHRSFIARDLPVQSLSVSGHLVLLSATTHCLLPAIPRPLVFHPNSCQWTLGPTTPTPRRWCAAGAAHGSVYIASGVGSEYNADVARSAHRWDPNERQSTWQKVASLKDGRFSREAVELVASEGKLCMVNLKGLGAKEGAVYDVGSDRWEEMPVGLVSGWTGPAAADEKGGPIYVVDEARGALKAYDREKDTWTVVVESERLKGAVQIAAGGGRVCVTCVGGAAVVVVDVARRMPGRMWVVYPPAGKRVIAVHVLPRMCRDES